MPFWHLFRRTVIWRRSLAGKQHARNGLSNLNRVMKLMLLVKFQMNTRNCSRTTSIMSVDVVNPHESNMIGSSVSFVEKWLLRVMTSRFVLNAVVDESTEVSLTYFKQVVVHKNVGVPQYNEFLCTRFIKRFFNKIKQTWTHTYLENISLCFMSSPCRKK